MLEKTRTCLVTNFLFTHHLNVDSCLQCHPTSSSIIAVGELCHMNISCFGAQCVWHSASFSALYCSILCLYSLDWNLLLFSIGKSSIKQTYRYRTLRWARGNHGTLYCREVTKPLSSDLLASRHTAYFLYSLFPFNICNVSQMKYARHYNSRLNTTHVWKDKIIKMLNDPYSKIVSFCAYLGNLKMSKHILTRRRYSKEEQKSNILYACVCIFFVWKCTWG